MTMFGFLKRGLWVLRLRIASIGIPCGVWIWRDLL